jgi:hypothetical protein
MQMVQRSTAVTVRAVGHLTRRPASCSLGRLQPAGWLLPLVVKSTVSCVAPALTVTKDTTASTSSLRRAPPSQAHVKALWVTVFVVRHIIQVLYSARPGVQAGGLQVSRCAEH